MAIVIFIYFSWAYMSSVLVRCFTWLCPVAAHKKQLGHALKLTCDSHSTETASFVRCKTFDYARQQWLELLDQYAVFEAPAGSWIGAAFEEPTFDTKSVRSKCIHAVEHAEAEDITFGESDSVDSSGVRFENEHAEVEHFTFGDVDREKAFSRAHKSGLELLEHYSVFGASVGSWTSSTVTVEA